MDGSIVFARWRLYTLPCGTLAAPGDYDWTCASFGPPESTTQTANDRFSRFWTAHGRKSLYFTMGDPFPQIAPSRGGIWTPSNSWFLEPGRCHSPNGISIGSAVFAQVTAECPYTLWRPFPQKLPLSMKGSRSPCNTGFLWTIRAHKPNGISIGSAVLAGLTSMTDTQRDRQTNRETNRQTNRPCYSVGNNRPYLRT